MADETSREDSPGGLSHLDAAGNARMVDVSGKQPTRRRARASGTVRMRSSTLEAIRAGGLPKGDVLAVARIAGIQAAKQTSHLIPLCHPLPIDSVSVDLELSDPDPGDTGTAAGTVTVRAEVIVTARTGAEMEALAAVSIAALTVYDMCKAVDPAIVIGEIRLEEKEGGKRGLYRHPDA